MLLPDVGGVGQKRLFAGAVVVESLDGAAEAAVTYLAGAGVGTLVIRDAGTVTEPGFLFEADDVGRPRLDAARERIARLNADVQVVGEGTGTPLGACADLAGAAVAALSAMRSLWAS